MNVLWAAAALILCGSMLAQSENPAASSWTAAVVTPSGVRTFQSFGIRCDGVTNDSAALNAMFRFVASSGGTVYWPGRCKANSAVAIPLVPKVAGITVKGLGSYAYQDGAGLDQYSSPSLLDCSGVTSGDCLDIEAPGVIIDGLDILYNGHIGGPLAPPPAPSLSQVPGACVVRGSQTFYAEITYTNKLALAFPGETVLSREGSLAVTPGHCLKVDPPPSAFGATGYKIYIGLSPNNEVQQNTTPEPLGTPYVMSSGSPRNTGLPPFVDTTASAAVYADNVPTIINSRVRSTIFSWGNYTTTYAPSDGLKLPTSYAHVEKDSVMGFNRGVVFYGFGPSNNASNDKPYVRDSFLRNNNYQVVASQANQLDVSGNEFMEAASADLFLVWGNVDWHDNYHEQNDRSITATFIVGSRSHPQPTNFPIVPTNVDIVHNYDHCEPGLNAPIVLLEAVQTVRIEDNNLSGCRRFIQNNASAGSNIRVRSNVELGGRMTSTDWLSSTTGVQEYDTTCSGESSYPCAVTFPGSAGPSVGSGYVFTAYCQGPVGPSPGATYYLSPGAADAATPLCSTSSAFVGNPMPISCTAQDLYTEASGAGKAKLSGAIRFLKNEGATSLDGKVVLGMGRQGSATIDMVPFRAGDTWVIGVTTAVANDTTANIRVSFVCK